MIKEAKYIISAVNENQFVDDNKDEYLFLGRSNVGKSSLINFLTNRKSLAKTSQTPGKTITLNFYLIDERFYLVDAPGYGYAKRSKTQIQTFGEMIENYLKTRQQLKAVLLLIDYKIGPTKDDLLMYEYLKHFNIDLTIVATKVDKLNQKERSASEKRFKENFKNRKIILTSSIKKTGLKELIEVFAKENKQ